jgi:hypothetical protein
VSEQLRRQSNAVVPTLPGESKPEPAERGTPNECCCPIVFGGRVTAGHCPIHGAAVLGEDGMREAHAIDRRLRFEVVE